jgi:hypothetical protein
MAEHDDVVEGWHKSSSSGGGECVEVSIANELVHVRDSKNRNEAILSFTFREWSAFLTGVRLGEFDVPEVDSA